MARMSRNDIIAFHPIESYLERIGAYPTRRHGNISCRCPLDGHEDRHPSFTVRDNRWTCWSHPGGKITGTIIDLVMRVESLSLAEAMKKLSR